MDKNTLPSDKKGPGTEERKQVIEEEEDDSESEEEEERIQIKK